MINTFDLIKIIGTPYVNQRTSIPANILQNIYKKAFIDRVALLYLTLYREPGWPKALEDLFLKLNKRRENTLSVISNSANVLNQYCSDEYAIFKSLKPYPATPNDTDIIIFGDKKRFEDVIEYLYSKGYCFHEWAPMQTTLYDPRGKGKIGKGKKGGTYYIDVYSDISTDYFMYIDKRSLIPYVHTIELNGIQVRTVRKEAELAIILFHNVFPERTFQLEHFYMPLFHFKEEDFDLDVLIEFAEKQKLSHAISTNLTIVEYIHNRAFGFVPDRIGQLLNRWSRNFNELERFKNMGEETPYLFSPRTFWMTFWYKIHDNAALKSLFTQGIHMLNPVFFLDVMKSLKNRFSERGTYHLE